jgi:hypothetical protein
MYGGINRQRDAMVGTAVPRIYRWIQKWHNEVFSYFALVPRQAFIQRRLAAKAIGQQSPELLCERLIGWRSEGYSARLLEQDRWGLREKMERERRFLHTSSSY